MDYSRYLNAVAKRRKPSAIRALQPLLQIPGMISLGGGMPNPETFPFQSIEVHLKDSKANSRKLCLNETETAKALQYSATNGIPEFVQWLKRLQTQNHQSSPSPFDICVTNGSQEGIAKAFEMVMSPGDSVCVESPLYSGTIAILRPMDCRMVAVGTDEEGLVASELDRILTGWDDAQVGSGKPRILYTVPTASNPTGVTTTEKRKREVYQVARKHDLLFNTKNRVPSYLSMDRVWSHSEESDFESNESKA